MTYLLIFSILLFGGAYYWYAKYVRIDALRKKPKPKPKTAPKKLKENRSEFRCVVIKPGVGACQAAKQLKGAILMHEAETLPLSSCNAEKCNCTYSRHNDRRMQSRRRDLPSAVEFMTAQKSRRNVQDRRTRDTPQQNSENRLDQHTVMLQ